MLNKNKTKFLKVVLIFSLVLIMLVSLLGEISLVKAQDFSDTPWLYQDWTQDVYVEENPPPPSDTPSPTLGGLSVFMEETGNIGLNILSLGWYGVAQRAYMYNRGINVPQTWAQAGLQTLDATPIAGSIKAAIEAPTWMEKTGHCCSALGGAFLLGYGGYRALSNRGGCVGGHGCPAIPGVKLHPKIEKAMEIVGEKGYRNIYRTLLNRPPKKMSIFGQIFHENFPFPRKGTWSAQEGISVPIFRRSPEGIARSLVHEGWHQYAYEQAMREFSQGTAIDSYGNPIGHYTLIKAYRGLDEYMAYRVAGRFGRVIGIRDPHRTPYDAALRGCLEFKKCTSRMKWKWPPE